jgi:hypothetical protein
MLAMAPPDSVVHQAISDDQAKLIDTAMHQDKLVDGWAQRNFMAAMALQMQRTDLGLSS